MNTPILDSKNCSCIKLIKGANRIDSNYLDLQFISIFKEYQKNSETVPVKFNYIQQGQDHFYDISLLAPYWPGIVETIASYIHDDQFKIVFSEFIDLDLENGLKSNCFLLYRLKLDSKQLLRFQKYLKNLTEIIPKAATEEAPIHNLMIHEIRKIPKYREVYNIILRHLKPNLIDEIAGKDGELIKFFANRTKDYINERNAEDLFDQIYTNYIFMKKLKLEPAKKIIYKVNNIRTKHENLTCITVVTHNGKLNLNMILQAIRRSFPRFIIRYIKRFSKDEMVILRLELSKPDESWFDNNAIRRIQNSLETLRSQGYLINLESLSNSGGYEHYARAIIPILNSECERSQITQYYISLENKEEYFIEFKIMVVFNYEKYPIENFAINFALDLGNINGLHIFKISPPSFSGKNEMDIIDVRIETEKLEENKTIYHYIKKALSKYFSITRDFDEGMRLMDSNKINFLRKKLPQYPEEIVSNFYYHLNEYYRISAYDEEIMDIIKYCYELYKKIIREGINYYVLSEQMAIQLSKNKTILNGSIFYIGYKCQNEKMSEILSVLSNFDLNFSRVDFENITIIIAIVKEEDKPLKAIPFQQLKQKLGKIFG